MTQPPSAAPTADTRPIEDHPFAPVLPPDADLMMMGTFPPTEDKWAMPFHYPNFYNDMWRIYGAVFFDDPDHFVLVKKSALTPSKYAPFSLSAVSPLVLPLSKPSARQAMPLTIT